MSKGWNDGTDIDALVKGLPAGAERALLRVLSFHKGREQAISRGELVEALRSHGFKLHERAIRALINQLRKDGQPICSTGGEDGGYWLAANWDELNDYLDREVHSRAMDLLEQEKALRSTGEKLWGALKRQMGLFK
jgi:hypothetical protein